MTDAKAQDAREGVPVVERLRECPFCQSRDAEIVSLRNGRSWGLCGNRKCFSQGPICDGRAEAAAAWNRRAA